MDRTTWERAVEVRAVAPLLVAATRQLVGTCTLVTNGTTTIGFTSGELLRLVANEALAIATRLDGSELLPIASWGPGSFTGMGLCAFATPFVIDPRLDVMPIAMGSVCASVDNRGAPTALVTILPASNGYARVPVPVWVDTLGDTSDVIARVVTPHESGDAGVPVEGAPVFARFPPNPALGRPAETLALALAFTYRAATYAPRGRPAIGEIVGLDDLARALPFSGQEQEPELRQVAGEIRDVAVKRVIDDFDD